MLPCRRGTQDRVRARMGIQVGAHVGERLGVVTAVVRHAAGRDMRQFHGDVPIGGDTQHEALSKARGYAEL